MVKKTIFYIIPTKTNKINKITPGTPNTPTNKQVIIFIGKVIKPVKLINHKIIRPITALIANFINFLPSKCNINLAINITTKATSAIFK